jgi:hypothetical protein
MHLVPHPAILANHCPGCVSLGPIPDYFSFRYYDMQWSFKDVRTGYTTPHIPFYSSRNRMSRQKVTRTRGRHPRYTDCVCIADMNVLSILLARVCQTIHGRVSATQRKHQYLRISLVAIRVSRFANIQKVTSSNHWRESCRISLKGKLIRFQFGSPESLHMRYIITRG